MMKLHLIDDWRLILRKAWSVKLMIFSGLCTMAEVLLPLYSDLFPRHVFAGLSVLLVVAGLVMRFVSQENCK
jgi:hypothetical protein